MSSRRNVVKRKPFMIIGSSFDGEIIYKDCVGGAERVVDSVIYMPPKVGFAKLAIERGARPSDDLELYINCVTKCWDVVNNNSWPDGKTQVMRRYWFYAMDSNLSGWSEDRLMQTWQRLHEFHKSLDE